MSVDTLRENFHINRISSDLLQDFLTAQTYRPEITLAKEKLLKLPHKLLQNLCDKPIRQGKSPTYAENGLKCIKPRNTVNLLVSLDDIDYIDPSTEDDISNQCLAYGDIVITRSGSGTIGRAAIFSTHEKIYTNDHLFIVRASKADSHYVACYLKSYYGARLLEAGISGSTGQLNLSNEHIKNLIIYTPHTLAQKYIGDKVRQAELLREWSKCKKNKLDLIFDKETRKLGYIEKSPKKYTRCKLDNRLDPAYYSSNYSFLDEEWFRNISFRLKNYIASGSYGVLPNSNSYGMGTEKFIRATDLPSVNINPKSYIVVPFEEVSAKAKVSTGEILLEIKGAISECQLASHSLNGYYVNGSIYRFKVQNIDAAYLTFYLRSFIKKLYCDRVSVNNIISYLDLESINNLPVVRLGDEIENIISQEFLLIELAQQLIFRISKSAQYLVEALILGVIDENKLVQAQNALEQGDNSLDRAILSQMTEDGYAVAGSKPLFADLDEFYELLEQAKELE